MKSRPKILFLTWSAEQPSTRYRVHQYIKYLIYRQTLKGIDALICSIRVLAIDDIVDRTFEDISINAVSGGIASFFGSI